MCRPFIHSFCQGACAGRGGAVAAEETSRNEERRSKGDSFFLPAVAGGSPRSAEEPGGPAGRGPLRENLRVLIDVLTIISLVFRYGTLGCRVAVRSECVVWLGCVAQTKGAEPVLTPLARTAPETRVLLTKTILFRYPPLIMHFKILRFSVEKMCFIHC